MFKASKKAREKSFVTPIARGKRKETAMKVTSNAVHSKQATRTLSPAKIKKGPGSKHQHGRREAVMSGRSTSNPWESGDQYTQGKRDRTENGK